MLLDHALQYAGRGWRVFPVHTTVTGQCSCGRACGKDAGKHPRIKAWQKHATTDPAQINAWWAKWSDANVGVACGSGLVVLDLDGAEEIERFKAIAKPHGGMPETLVAQTGRGFHLYLSGELAGSGKADGLLVRGEGGYVVAPPSLHASGQRYQWVRDVLCAPMPDWFKTWVLTRGNTKQNPDTSLSALGPLPGYISRRQIQPNQGLITKRSKLGSSEVPQTEAEFKRIASALGAIPASISRDPWLHVGMALHSLHWERPDGSDLGFEMWRAWSETGGEKFQGVHDLETRWKSFGKPGRERITLGTLYHLAEQHGWIGNAPRAYAEKNPRREGQGQGSERVSGMENSAFQSNAFASGAGHGQPPGSNEALGSIPYANGHTIPLPKELSTPLDESPLISLNQKYAAIGDIGGKCLVLGWVPSKIDATVSVPSLQSFSAFRERYANQYVMVEKEKRGELVEEPAQVGTYWLNWRKRRSFEGIDLVPGGGYELPGKILNLWQGYAVQPHPGRWDRMKEHVAEILAEGDPKSLEYIMKWSAWAVQNPGERAEVAMVFKGDKGSGKGTFANALRQIFGPHGLQIFASKHLVGSFNAHLANCLFLFADEAFWAGDKQGESTLKGLVTEPVAMIEKKGIDAIQWKNRLHIIMSANAEWVVPASHDERRYAVFQVSSKQKQSEKYFSALKQELDQGGLSAMLHDLLQVQLGDWHPRRIVNTEALRQQKIRSMNHLQEWWESILQDGAMPVRAETPDSAMSQYLIHHCREFAPRLKDLTTSAFGRFLSEQGCIKLHKTGGNAWRFPSLAEARDKWTRHYNGWEWHAEAGEWSVRT